MTRGEIWTVAGGGDYAGKPRPVVIVQDDMFLQTLSITVCAITTQEVDAPLLRIPVSPSVENGLKLPSRLMVDKLTTVPRSRLGARIGRLAETELVQLTRALAVFLGLAGEQRG